MKMMMNSFCGIVDRRNTFTPYFQSGPLSEIFNIANFRHPASRVLTCAESEFKLCWMKLCSSDNHFTTALHIGVIHEGKQSTRANNLASVIYNMKIVQANNVASVIYYMKIAQFQWPKWMYKPLAPWCENYKWLISKNNKRELLIRGIYFLSKICISVNNSIRKSVFHESWFASYMAVKDSGS